MIFPLLFLFIFSIVISIYIIQFSLLNAQLYDLKVESWKWKLESWSSSLESLGVGEWTVESRHRVLENIIDIQGYCL